MEIHFAGFFFHDIYPEMKRKVNEIQN